jgi:hypothetical protein
MGAEKQGSSVELEIGSVAPQMDDTDKMAVSLYGKDSAAGDKEVNVSAAGNLEVDLKTFDAGETHLGEVGGNSVVVELTLSLDTGAYADGDVLAATQELSSAMRVNGGTGVWQSLTLLDEDDQGGILDIILLRTNVAIGTENAAVSITDAAADEIIGIVEVAAADYVDMVNSQLVVKGSLGIVVDAAAGATSLFVAAVSRDAKTYTASGIKLKFGFLRD